ncbi:MAG: branched-chain amino acid ABC transporter permease [Chloroflexi bacterium]|nr:MAG: branched-chain amino acid ABC transporter permease [Chloroflexota bacterium]
MERLRQIPRDFRYLIALGVVLAIVPLLLNQFLLSVAIQTVYWAFLGTSWNIMGGYAGQFSFGHAAFYGIGAYTSTVLLVDYGISPWLGMLVGAAFAALFGLIIGYLSFQFGLKGHFFALATFAFAEMLRLVSTELEIVNTSVGIHIPPVGGDSWSKMQFENTPEYYFYVIALFLIVGLFITIIITRSKIGYYFQAIREDEEAAAALGVDTLRYKIYAVMISAAMAAIGGSFFIQFFLFVDPSLAFGVAISIGVLLRPIVGGVGTIWGPLVGALLLSPLAEFTRSFVRTPPSFLSFIEGRAGVDVMIFGVILIVIIIFAPEGVAGIAPRLWRRYQTGRDVDEKSKETVAA